MTSRAIPSSSSSAVIFPRSRVRIPRLLLLFVPLALFLGRPSVAASQSPDTKAAAESAFREARELIKQGVG
jgi:hypothetical protein